MRKPTVSVVAADAPLSGVDVPVLDLNDVAAIADFIVERYGLDRR